VKNTDRSKNLSALRAEDKILNRCATSRPIYVRSTPGDLPTPLLKSFRCFTAHRWTRRQ